MDDMTPTEPRSQHHWFNVTGWAITLCHSRHHHKNKMLGGSSSSAVIFCTTEFTKENKCLNSGFSSFFSRCFLFCFCVIWMSTSHFSCGDFKKKEVQCVQCIVIPSVQFNWLYNTSPGVIDMPKLMILVTPVFFRCVKLQYLTRWMCGSINYKPIFMHYRNKINQSKKAY